MGMFTQRPEKPGAWAALPGEPLDEPDPTDTLPAASDSDLTDPAALLSPNAAYTSIAFPAAPVPEEGTAAGDSEGP